MHENNCCLKWEENICCLGKDSCKQCNQKEQVISHYNRQWKVRGILMKGERKLKEGI